MEKDVNSVTLTGNITQPKYEKKTSTGGREYEIASFSLIVLDGQWQKWIPCQTLNTRQLQNMHSDSHVVVRGSINKAKDFFWVSCTDIQEGGKRVLERRPSPTAEARAEQEQRRDNATHEQRVVRDPDPEPVDNDYDIPF